MGFSRLRDRLEDDDAGKLIVAIHTTRIGEPPLTPGGFVSAYRRRLGHRQRHHRAI